jgi:hypothetical protein
MDNGETEEFDGLNEGLDSIRKLKFEFQMPLLVNLIKYTHSTGYW